jgi:hypothetical protein
VILFTVDVAGQNVGAQQMEFMLREPRLLGQLTASGIEMRLLRLDRAAHKPPLLGVDRGLLVSFLHKQPSTLIDQSDENDVMHVRTLTEERVVDPASCPALHRADPIKDGGLRHRLPNPRNVLGSQSQ